MAVDKKDTELDENVDPQLTDIFRITDDPPGTPKSEKITYSNLINTTKQTITGTLVTGNATAIIDEGTTGAAGILELATAAEISSGDADLAVSPEELKASDFGLRSAILQPIADDTTHDVADAKQYFPTPEWMAGWNLIDVRVRVITPGTVSGLFSVQIYNLTQTANMLSTVCSVDPTEYSSDDAATPVVVDTAEDDITQGDVLRIDFKAIHGTPGEGCYVELVFQLP